MFEVTHVDLFENLWDVATLNTDPQNNKSDHTFSHNCLVRPRQNNPGQSAGKNEPSWSFNYPNSHKLKFYSMVIIIPNYFKNVQSDQTWNC